MAQLNSKGQLSGMVGPVTFRIYNGKTIVQSKPGRGNVKQTAATKSISSDFGTASTASKRIRTALIPILQEYADRAMYRRLTTRLFEVLLTDPQHPNGKRKIADGDLSLLKGFQFNANSPFSKYCTLAPQITYDAAAGLTISLPTFNPEQSIKTIPQASDVTVCFLVTAFNKDTFEATHTEIFTLEIPLDGNDIAAQQWQANELQENSVVMVTVGLFYYRKNNLVGRIGLNGREVGPCEVVGVALT